jgi:hypothetical protein
MAKITRTTNFYFYFRDKISKRRKKVLKKAKRRSAPEPKIGLTIAFNPQTKRFGIAKCHPELDNFCRKVGRSIASERTENTPKASKKTTRKKASKQAIRSKPAKPQSCHHIPYRSRRFRGRLTIENVKEQALIIATEFGFCG